MAQTPTIQDILSSYQEGVGAGGTNTALLLQALRNRQSRAQEEDVQTAKGWQSRGKAGLNIYKARRDYLLAKRGNPDLKFMDFMSDPKTSAKYMTQGTDAIVTGESPAISLRETFGFGQPKSTQQSPYFGEDEIARQSKQAMRSGDIPNLEKILMSEGQFNMAPELEGGIMSPRYDLAQTQASNVSPPSPLGDVSGQGLQDMLARRQSNFTNQALGGVSPSSGAVSPSGIVPNFGASAISEGVLPQGVQRVAGNQASQDAIQQAMDEARLRVGAQKASQVIPSQVPSETGASTGAMGTAGQALGAFGVGKGLFDTFGATNTEDRQEAMLGTAAAGVGMVNPPLGLALGILSMLAKRR